MYHEEFYLNRRTGEKVYNWNQAVKWIVSGDSVLHYHHDGGCTVCS